VELNRVILLPDYHHLIRDWSPQIQVNLQQLCRTTLQVKNTDPQREGLSYNGAKVSKEELRPPKGNAC
jgi:hypothetical protein